MFEKIVLDVFVGAIVAILGVIAKWQWPFIRSLFDEESRRQAAQVSGLWEAIEQFPASHTQNKYTMHVKCRGGRVSGQHVCIDGPDKGKTFDLNGSYKDQILTFTWAPFDREALESGTVTARLSKDKLLQGHGLYIEPDDGKVYTSTYTATKS